jgi:uroporphyrinogen-III decarboxylase
MEKLSSHDRILRTIAGQPVDRIPIYSPIRWTPLAPEPEPGDWKAHPNHQALVSLASQWCDPFVKLAIPERIPLGGIQDRWNSSHTGIFDRRFLMIPPECVQVVEDGERAGRRVTRYRVNTPKGDLTTTEAVTPGVDTIWMLEPLIKDVEDAEKILAVPYRFDPPDLTSFLADKDKLGDRGVTVLVVSSPLVMVSRMMDFQTFLEWTITERSLIDRMMRVAQERTIERLQYALQNGAGPLIRFSGCEQATPPMMSNRFFDGFIVKYEAPLWQITRDAGRIVSVHCHGKVATIIDKFVDLGVQVLDPVEPPPQGDIEIGEAKKRAARGPMTLIGNVELSMLQSCSVDQVEREVRRAICEGGRQYFILGASSLLCSAVDDHLRDNITRFIEAGIKYGSF